MGTFREMVGISQTLPKADGWLLYGHPFAQNPTKEYIVRHSLKVFLLSAALVVPVVARAQERDRQDRRQSDHQTRRYEDRAHNDFHEWNNNEDQAYRRYLQENRRKYHDFATAKKKDQHNYWNWRHSHRDEGR